MSVELPPLVCYCLCAKAHPDDTGICETFSPVVSRRYQTWLLGVVDVALCAPCAIAQGLHELAIAQRQRVPAFTCPRCGRTSHNLQDVAAGYCGACHDWTREP